MSNSGKSDVSTSNSRNDERCSASASSGRKCEMQTETVVSVTSNGIPDRILNKVQCCGEQTTMHTVPDVKISLCDLSEAKPEFLISTIKELQRKIEYTEKMNWLCKLKIILLFCDWNCLD